MSAFPFDPQGRPGFAALYRQFVASVVREPSPPLVRPTLRERLVRCLWFDQEFDDVLRTEDGGAVTVLSPGWWNLESGPDFRQAALRVDRGKTTKGDVEVHVYASGWTEHGHHQDEAYNGVVLHVVMWNDTGSATTPLEDGREVPMLALDRHVDKTPEQLTESVDTAEYPHAAAASAGRCEGLLARARVDPDWVGQFLDHAGDERMLRKAERFAAMPEAAGPDALLYVGLMEAAGFKKNKKPMGRLARLVTHTVALRLLDERGVAGLQAALFGMAGLLPEQPELPGAESDPETAAYLARLRQEWAAIAPPFEGAPMETRAWNLGGTRPVNHPLRRLAGMSQVLERTQATGGLVAAVERELRRAPAAPSRRIARSPAAKAISGLFTGVADEYWSRRTSFGGKKLRSETKLIGGDRAAVMFVDAVVPVVLAATRARRNEGLENRLHRAYATFPKLPANSVLRFMAARVFGGEEPADAVVTSARRQQGLLQLFRDYCERDAEGCRRCAFAAALESGGISAA